ncbi:DUF998 domain-containing protein [Neiella marina]|nr:DUF998 domain-containing protein [Neiella marina]
MTKIISLLPLLSAGWFALTVIVAGWHFPNYQHSSQFISELGATGAPYGALVNFVGFLPASMALVSFAALILINGNTTAKQTVGLLGVACYGATLSIAAIYPCDYGCRPPTPSSSQMIHNLSALVGYSCGVIAVLLLAADVLKERSRAIAMIGFVLGSIAAVLLLSIVPSSPIVGLIQRLFELVIYSWIVLYALTLPSLQSRFATRN